MSESKRPLAALAGAGFFVLGVIGALLYPSGPDFVDSPATIAEFYVDNDSDILVSDVLYLLAGSLLLVFVGFLRSAYAIAEGGAGKLAGIAFAGGVAGAALALGGAAFDAVGALRVDEQGALDPATATVYWDASSVLFGLAAPMAIAVLVLASAVLSFRHAVLPRWLGAISVVLGIALLIPPINWAAMIAFTLWALVAAIVLYMRPVAAGTSA